jgi:hypothetical protein
MMNPFEFLNSINDTKKDIMIDDLDEKGLCFFYDQSFTVLLPRYRLYC